jgi:hypothetical protein
MLYVLNLDGEKLFEGSRHDCKQFIRRNRTNRYRITSKFIEKAVKKDNEEFNEVFDSE